ncbi:MAG: DUF2946 family protein [Sulfuritalea sp.]|nr:DUF2946 family protein [Sulfuritalea sp.]
MSDPDVSAAVKWPSVPACHGWLSLDRRGAWRLRGEPIRHSGLIAFINAHYAADESGKWIFQNGPQTVFVSLDYTPLVWRMDPDASLTAHTGAAGGAVAAAYLDEEGNVLLHAACGIGLLDDRDLGAFVAACLLAGGTPAVQEDLLGVMEGGSGVFWRGLPLQSIRRLDVPWSFGFDPDPRP